MSYFFPFQSAVDVALKLSNGRHFPQSLSYCRIIHTDLNWDKFTTVPDFLHLQTAHTHLTNSYVNFYRLINVWHFVSQLF